MNAEILVKEIIELLPEFVGREQELKDIVDKLLQSQPKVEMDENFKEELRRKVLEEASRKKKVIPFRRKLFFILPGAAAAGLAVVLILGTLVNPKGEDVLNLSLSGSRQSEGITSRFQEEDQDPVESTLESEKVEEAPSREESTTQIDTKTEDLSVVEQRRDKKDAPSPANDVPAESPSLTRSLGAGDSVDFYMEDELFGVQEMAINEMALDSSDSVFIESEIQDERTGNTGETFNTEEFDRIYENDFLSALSDPVSTFSIDVDTASYSNTRRYLMNGARPPADAVRIEELINYFDYDYPDVTGEHPFEFHTAMSPSPWNQDNMLLFVGVQGERMAFENLPPNNLVFLLDVSGSMSDANKLPLLKQSLEMLTKQLRPQDRVSIVVYAGAAGVVLEPTAGNRTKEIINAFDRLEAGGSTAGGQGIELAYTLAEENLMEEGNNRIIIATDGDFNVGPSSTSETTRLIEEKRNKGIFLTVLGFGMGNYKDSRMEQMADKGNGNYAYIDNILEAKKVLVNEISSTLFTIASDVKIQIEFNPYLVDEYRLIGYENRVMANQDFDDDTKDAGELGAGHSVTAIYEIKRADRTLQSGDDGLKYQNLSIDESAASTDEVMTIKFRYKNPGEEESTLLEKPVAYEEQRFGNLDSGFRFAAAVAQWGMLLRDSAYKGDSSYQWVIDTVRDAKASDPYGLKAEFLNLVDLSRSLD